MKFYQKILLAIIVFSVWERLNIFVGFSLTPVLLLFPFFILTYFFSFETKRFEAVKENIVLIFPKPLWKVIIACILIHPLSVLVSAFPGKVLTVSIFYFIKWCIFIGIVTLMHSKTTEKIVLKTWLLATSITSGIALLQFALYKWSIKPTLPWELWIQGLGFTMNNLPADHFTFPVGNLLFIRPSSTFIDTNTAAGFLAVSLVILLGQWLSSKEKSTWTLPILLIHLIAFGTMISRSGWMGLICGCVALYVLNKKTIKLPKNILWWSLPILLFFVAFLGQRILISLTESSFNEHLHFASSALQLWARDPLLGIGSGTFESAYKLFIDPNVQYVSNLPIFLHWLVELGILGLIIHLIFILFILKTGWKQAQHNKETAILLSAFIALLGANIFYSYLISPAGFVVMGMVVGGISISKNFGAMR